MRIMLRLVRRSISSSRLLRMPIKVGDELPSIELDEGSNESRVNILELFKGKTGILFAVPGAFTPGCSKTHLPGYIQDFQKFKDKGVDLVACVSVNDPFVMSAWGEAHKTEGKVRMLADTNAEFSKAVDLTVDARVLGGIRSKRYSMVVKDGRVTALNIEPDGYGLTCTLAEKILDQL